MYFLTIALVSFFPIFRHAQAMPTDLPPRVPLHVRDSFKPINVTTGCSEFYLYDLNQHPTITATCQGSPPIPNSESPSYTRTMIDLNHCLANINGTLNPTPEGNFAATCLSRSFDGSSYTAECATDSTSAQRSKNTTISIDALLDNDEGLLRCGGIHGQNVTAEEISSRPSRSRS